MADHPDGSSKAVGADRLLAYVAELELEVDRLRRQARFIEKTATETLTRILRLCTGPGSGESQSTLAEVGFTARQLVEVVRDLHDSSGYHPAHDQVVAIAVRPLAEQVFRWQQRLTGSHEVELRLEFAIDSVEWFPARLRHILDNLFAHALRHREPTGIGPWVALGLRTTDDSSYELRISCNGSSLHPGQGARGFELFDRTTPTRAADLGGGLAVVRLLVEQSGGLLHDHPGEDRGVDFVLTLPRYDLLDYLE